MARLPDARAGLGLAAVTALIAAGCSSGAARSPDRGPSTAPTGPIATGKPFDSFTPSTIPYTNGALRYECSVANTSGIAKTTYPGEKIVITFSSQAAQSGAGFETQVTARRYSASVQASENSTVLTLPNDSNVGSLTAKCLASGAR
jgi:hypothetical protein